MLPTYAAVHKFSVLKAQKIQLSLSKKIIAEDQRPQKIELIAGVDVAYTKEQAIGAVAVLNYKTLELLEKRSATCQVKFPYIPTLLSFREIPPAVACIKKLRRQPDVLLVDGHGAAHPYGCGFASYLGLVIGKSTVGVAKSILVGESKIIAGQEFLIHKDQIIGAVVTTKDGSKPVYVSVGHLTSLEKAVKIVKHCVCNTRIPKPILEAHNIAAEERRKVQEKNKTL